MIDNLAEILENTMITEDPISSQIASLLNIDEQQATSMVKGLSFSNYLALADAIKMQDADTAKSLLSVEEDANAFRSARTPNAPNLPYDPMQDKMGQEGEQPGIDFTAARPGSQLNINGQDIRVKDIDDNNHVTTINTQDGQTIEYRDRNAPPDFTPNSPEEAQIEIDRIKQLAGIKDVGVEEGGAIASAAIAGAVTGPATIRDRHRKKKKPGPKV